MKQAGSRHQLCQVREGICLENSFLKMQRHSFKNRMKFPILCQKFRLYFVFLKSSTSALFKDIVTLIRLWETIPLGFQPQPHYQMNSSLINDSPMYFPLKELIRRWWESQKGPFLSWIEGEQFFSFIPILVVRTKLNLHHLKKKILRNFNQTIYTFKVLQWCFKCQAYEKLCTDR